MNNTANEFLQFLSDPQEQENNIQGMTPDGKSFSIYRFPFGKNVSAYYAAVEPGIQRGQEDFQCSSIHFLAIQCGQNIVFIQGNNMETLFGQDGASHLRRYSGRDELNFYNILYYAQAAIQSRDKRQFRNRLPGAENGFHAPLHALDVDTWRFVFDTDFESHLETRFVSILQAIQNPVLDCWGNVSNPVNESLTYWDKWMTERVMASIFEPDFLHYNLSQDKDEYIAALKREANLLKDAADHPIFQYIKIPAILKKRLEVTIDFVDESGKWRSILVSNQAFSTMEYAERYGEKTMLMPIQNVAIDTEKAHNLSGQLFQHDSPVFPGVKYWIPWCRIIDVRDGNEILWLNREEDVKENQPW